jgi:HAE1 family hydrophobic/amphiphilic exporter-1
VLGTLFAGYVLGYTLNIMTLGGLALAVGLIVDDAIVVIENIERHMRERGSSAPQASSTAMAEVASAVIATSLVLIAVFIPVAFFPGTTGRLYKQFSLTIAFSIAISAFNAVTLAPALAAVLLKNHGATPRLSLFKPINRAIAWLSASYNRTLRASLRRPRVMTVAFVILFALTALVYRIVPSGFVPTEDQNYFLVILQAPEGASLDYTSKVMAQVEAKLFAIPEISHVFAVAGFSFSGSAPNRGMFFPGTKPLSQRPGAEHSVNAILDRLRGELDSIPGAQIFAFAPPAIDGTDSVGGFTFELLDQGNNTPQRLAEVSRAVADEAATRKELTGVFSGYTANDPQYVVRIEREKAKALGVPLSEISDALQVFMGSAYVNDFDFNARSYRVYAQAGQKFRATPQDIEKFYVRSTKGQMISLGNLVTVSEETAPPLISHFNLFRSTEMNGSAAPGHTSGQAIAAMEDVARKVLPDGMSFAWSGLSLEEMQARGKSVLIFGLGVLFVFLVLSAQYESFALPFIILLAVPVAILGALSAQFIRGLPNDVFCQIGLVMLVGLASKNAILIVEFAEQLRATGKSIEEAAVEAAETRLRPILMTSLAFILGILPLVFAHGAGQEARHSLGTPVLGGMLASTLLNLYFIPVLYIGFERLRERFSAKPAEASSHA